MRPSSDGTCCVWTTAGRFCFLARASAGSTNIVVTTAAAMMLVQQRMLMFGLSQSCSASRFTPDVPRCERVRGSLLAPLLQPRGHQLIYLTSIVLDAARIRSKHKLILPDLNHTVADVEAGIMKLLTRPPFNAVTAPRQRRKKPARCLRLL